MSPETLYLDFLEILQTHPVQLRRSSGNNKSPNCRNRSLWNRSFLLSPDTRLAPLYQGQ